MENPLESLKIEHKGDNTLITPTGKNIATLGDDMMKTVDSLLLKGKHYIIVDMRNIEYVDSGLIGKFLALAQRVAQVRRCIKFSRVNPRVMSVLERVNLDKTLSIHATNEIAMDSGWNLNIEKRIAVVQTQNGQSPTKPQQDSQEPGVKATAILVNGQTITGDIDLSGMQFGDYINLASTHFLKFTNARIKSPTGQELSQGACIQVNRTHIIHIREE
jgi:anti-anti-sigma factor